jgi:hypothetical protein
MTEVNVCGHCSWCIQHLLSWYTEQMHNSRLLESTVFWDIMLWSSTEEHQCFRAMYCVHLQCQNVCQARSQHETSDKKSEIYLSPVSWCLLFNPEDRQYIPLKHQWTTTGLHDETSQKTVLFTVITVRTSIPTKTAYSVHTLFRWINKESSKIWKRQFLLKIRILVKLVY